MRPAALASLVALLLAGCPGRPPPSQPFDDVAELLGAYRDMRRPARVLRAEASVDRRGGEARIRGTVVHRHTRSGRDDPATLRILQPSGVSVVGAEVEERAGHWHARLASVYRTQRRLFEGSVLIPASRCAPSATCGE